ncbi:hypothetical protein [Bifidobacterium sp. SO1]|uniref:hypothetical protein n=1 Tax=Bifidobacterium sp. SO1 TaxID=2809029 RepID=UPI001BDDB881|nr:hypothetical protein [Bifidobacterium sp. SO1]MBT1161248.1 hypothetical protein [Bifidobacterium sp. SO1]
MKLKHTVSIPLTPSGNEHTGTLTLNLPYITDGKASDSYRDINGITGYVDDSRRIVYAFNSACEAFQTAFQKDMS